MEELIGQFIDRYLPRNEVAYRLPVRTAIGTFWPELLTERRRQAIPLPLRTQAGESFWYVLNRTIERQADRVAELSRREVAFELLRPIDAENGLIDEAVWSSAIEGAFTSRAEAAKLIREKRLPADRSEQMIGNNYRALTYVLEHLEDRITKQLLVTIAQLLTREASEEPVTDYRSGAVYVTGSQGTVYTPPPAESVPQLMEDLIDFINESDTHPILKACIAHFYLVYVHPFTDSNGRTARALSYMLLLRSGYDLFRYFSISGLIAEERGRYYRAMLWVEDEANSGSDMTYFIDYYTGMLSRVVERMEQQLFRSVYIDRLSAAMGASGRFGPRQISGIVWLLHSDHDHVTVEQWRRKHGIVTETARKDLIGLAEAGLLRRSSEGRRAVFMLPEPPEALLQVMDGLRR